MQVLSYSNPTGLSITRQCPITCQLSLAVFSVCPQGELLSAMCSCPSHGDLLLPFSFVLLLMVLILTQSKVLPSSLPCPFTGSSFLLTSWRLSGSILYSTSVNSVHAHVPDLGTQNSASECTAHKTNANTVWLCKVQIVIPQ